MHIFPFHHQYKQFLNAYRGKLYPGGHCIPAHKRLGAVGADPLAVHRRIQCRQLRRRAMPQSVFLPQGVLFLAEQQPALVQKGDGIAQLFQVADDVGGDEDGVVLIPGKVQQQIGRASCRERV